MRKWLSLIEISQVISVHSQLLFRIQYGFVSLVLSLRINLSLCTGILPNCLKLTLGTPIPKGGDLTNASNCRKQQETTVHQIFALENLKGTCWEKKKLIWHFYVIIHRRTIVQNWISIICSCIFFWSDQY